MLTEDEAYLYLSGFIIFSLLVIFWKLVLKARVTQPETLEEKIANASDINKEIMLEVVVMLKEMSENIKQLREIKT